MPLYINEGKTHLVVAIGCTGGQHRSVVLTESLAKKLEAKNTMFLFTTGISPGQRWIDHDELWDVADFSLDFSAARP